MILAGILLHDPHVSPGVQHPQPLPPEIPVNLIATQQSAPTSHHTPEPAPTVICVPTGIVPEFL